MNFGIIYIYPCSSVFNRDGRFERYAAFVCKENINVLFRRFVVVSFP